MPTLLLFEYSHRFINMHAFSTMCVSVLGNCVARRDLSHERNSLLDLSLEH